MEKCFKATNRQFTGKGIPLGQYTYEKRFDLIRKIQIKTTIFTYDTNNNKTLMIFIVDKSMEKQVCLYTLNGSVDL